MATRASFTPSNNHWVYAIGLYRERVTREQLRYHLLNNPDPIYQGELCTWRNKHIGAGIYELWIEERKKSSKSNDTAISEEEEQKIITKALDQADTDSEANFYRQGFSDGKEVGRRSK